MCLILFAYQKHPKYQLIVAANRDEFYHRQTAPANFWGEHPEILAGKDLEAGGTWMGITKSRKLAMLTNYRDLKNIKANAPSRGRLVLDYLTDEIAPNIYLKNVAAVANEYNGFNLITVQGDSLYYFGNYQQGVHEVEPGIHGLSNALLNTSWPKVERGREKLKELIDKDAISSTNLFELLYDEVHPPIEKLPDTGVGLEMERMLSPMFIKSKNYGTRCSTVILIDKENNISFAERTYNLNNFSYKDRNYFL